MKKKNEKPLILKFTILELGENDYVIEKYISKTKTYKQLPIHYFEKAEAELDKIKMEKDNGGKYV